MAKQDDYTRYTIRIPTPLYERVKSAAGEKSVNAEIVATLEEKYPAPLWMNRPVTEVAKYIYQSATDDEMAERLAEVNAEYAGTGIKFDVAMRFDEDTGSPSPRLVILTAGDGEGDPLSIFGNGSKSTHSEDTP